MKLYKYCAPDRIDILKNGRIRFTQPHVFNDPFEMLPSIGGLLDEQFLRDAMEKDDYNEHATQEFLKEVKKYPLYSALPDDTLKAMYSNLLPHLKPIVGNLFDIFSKHSKDVFQDGLYQGFSQNVGILCLSETPWNLLMWGHYTNCHEGFVIEFDSGNPFFDQRKTQVDELRQLSKVSYVTQRPTLYVNNLNYTDVCLTKSDDWSYEQEWRMIMSLEDTSVRIDNPKGDICLYDFPRRSITGIILGCRTDTDVESKIMETLDSHNDFRDVAVYRCSTHKQRYGLTVQMQSRNIEDGILKVMQHHFPSYQPLPVNETEILSKVLNDLGIYSTDAFGDFLGRFGDIATAIQQSGIRASNESGDWGQKEILDLLLFNNYGSSLSELYSRHSRQEERISTEAAIIEELQRTLTPEQKADLINISVSLGAEALGIPQDMIPKQSVELNQHEEEENGTNAGNEIVSDDEVPLNEAQLNALAIGMIHLYNSIPVDGNVDNEQRFSIFRVIASCPECRGNLEIRIVENQSSEYYTSMGMRCVNQDIFRHDYNAAIWEEIHPKIVPKINDYWLLKKHGIPIHRSLNEQEISITIELDKKRRLEIESAGTNDNPEQVQ